MPRMLQGQIADGLPNSSLFVLVQQHAAGIVTVTHATPTRPMFTNVQTICNDLDEAQRLAEKISHDLEIETIYLQLQ